MGDTNAVMFHLGRHLRKGRTDGSPGDKIKLGRGPTFLFENVESEPLVKVGVEKGGTDVTIDGRAIVVRLDASAGEER